MPYKHLQAILYTLALAGLLGALVQLATGAGLASAVGALGVSFALALLGYACGRQARPGR